ncbi:uncharacterized protein LOC130728742 [Lotus japonicus]|uniref:uncharacterized protein LOC130728742 n=1 Tax=Lotus japonicus TaxID=34305 RepID=UPI00258D1C60|nr:uncharacterized protein LOC130728742 [Lotus japonicus]
MNQNEVSRSDSGDRILKHVEDKEEQEDEEGEEDEDADFNPFLKGTSSHEASSSLSSEVDGLDGNVVNSASAELSKEKNCATVDSEHGEEEIVLQSPGMISQSEANQEKDNGLTSLTDGNGFRRGELNKTTKPRSPVIDIDSDDAICKRTRARYSLASFTLDELETFLQETDDDDDIQNADDEEEYKKFLAAVLQDGDGDGLSTHGNENPDDEDEDNDADFEIELEELLESDGDDNAVVKTQKEYDGSGRRPETRQNKRRKVSAQSERKPLGQFKRPLRPILPNWQNEPPASGKDLMPEANPSFQSSASGNAPVNGFTPAQIGQLHSLIHEHVQLLIQVFSLSVLDPPQKHTASQVQSLLFEMLHKRDEVLASKGMPYPTVCFTPSFACTSASNGTSKFVPGQLTKASASTQDVQSVCFSQSNQSSSEDLNRQRSCFQDIESTLRVPSVHSVLDVSPLNFVRRYVNGIYSASQEFRKRYIESGCEFSFEKEPLFPSSSSFTEASTGVSSGTIPGAVRAVSTSPGQQQPKKTLAAMLVESTKQSSALVPKEVAKLTQRFFSDLFNPELFPHKPPPPAVVNRILFTDSEDELLSLGILEYNTDWKAIQQRFLPCKSKHQIFVRQKNRSSAKASENPIKAVRRMKTSPLTAEEIACIQEGLKHYKFDWMSVWQFIVPYRDPALLPRQWRVACGTQKSYKVDASKKDKRRSYESERRKLKAARSASRPAISDKEDCEAEIMGSENCMDYSDVPYVHQAFLADWRPDTSAGTYSEHISSTSGEGNLARDAVSRENIQFYRAINDYGLSGKVQHQNYQHAFPFTPKFPQLFHTTSERSGTKGAPCADNPKNSVFTSSTNYYYRPYRSRKVNNAHLVILAPDLPPVNLPPSVRVVSQTAFKGFQCGTSKMYPPGGSVTGCRIDNIASQIPHGEKYGTAHPVEGAGPVLNGSVTGSQVERSGTAEGRSTVAEKSTCSELQMHPLLFQATNEGNIPYYPLKFSSGTSSSFSFFSGSQPQLNLSLFHSSQKQSSIDCASKSLRSKNSMLRSAGIDFHPLLQKFNDTQSQACSDDIQAESLVNSGVLATANRSSGLNDKSNELDLDIHLSSVSRNGKSVKSKQLEVQDPIGSKKTASTCGTAMKCQENSVPCRQQGVENPTTSCCELTSSAPLVVPDDNITRYDVDDVGDQSHPGIVMEQEELSDSEEDIEEHVEFECEEMDDSEGEDGSGSENALKVQNKEVPRDNPGTQVTNIATLDMGLTREGKDGKNKNSWLSLDSSSTDNFEFPKAMLQRGADTIAEEDTASRNSTICKAVTEARHPMHIAQQRSAGPQASVEKSSYDVNREDG